MNTLFQTLLQIVMIFSFSFSAIASGENKVALVVVEHWPPWEIAYDAKKQEVTDGLAVEIVKELFNRLNIKIKLKYAPWKRALMQIENGESDLIPMITPSCEREAYMIFTIPVYEDPLLFVYSTDKFKTFEWERWEDLKPFVVGITRGYDYGILSEVIKNYNLRTQVATTDRQNVLKLLVGRFDITPLYYVNAVAIFKEIPDHEKLRFAKKSIEKTVFSFGISKKSFLVTRFREINKTIQEMKYDGTFKKILGKFYISDNK